MSADGAVCSYVSIVFTFITFITGKKPYNLFGNLSAVVLYSLEPAAIRLTKC